MLESSRDLVYYVHYEEHDRRLDEWVPLSRFDLEALRRAPPPDGGDGGADGPGDAPVPGTRGRTAARPPHPCLDHEIMLLAARTRYAQRHNA